MRHRTPYFIKDQTLDIFIKSTVRSKTFIFQIWATKIDINILWLEHTYPYHDQPHDVPPRFMEDESGTCKHPLLCTVNCWSPCGGPPLSPSFMRMQSFHQPLKAHSYIVIHVFGGAMLVEYPPTLAQRTQSLLQTHYFI